MDSEPIDRKKSIVFHPSRQCAEVMDLDQPIEV